MSPASLLTILGEVSHCITPRLSWALTHMSSVSSQEIEVSMAGLYTQSLTMIRESAHSMHKTISGISSMALTRECVSTTHWNTSTTSHLSPRLCVSVRHPTSSSCTKKRSARLKNACQRLDSSRTQVPVGWKELTHWIGLRPQQRNWITGQL